MLKPTEIFKNGYYFVKDELLDGLPGKWKVIQPVVVNYTEEYIEWGNIHLPKPYRIEFKDLHPVKLNHHWLEKFEFNIIHTGDYRRGDLIWNPQMRELYIMCEKGYRFGQAGKVYVHEFQKAYCLIKKEELQ